MMTQKILDDLLAVIRRGVAALPAEPAEVTAARQPVPFPPHLQVSYQDAVMMGRWLDALVETLGITKRVDLIEDSIRFCRWMEFQDSLREQRRKRKGKSEWISITESMNWRND